MERVGKHCQALKRQGETSGMCCSNANVQLDPLQPPPQLLDILLIKGGHHGHEH